MNSVTVIGGGLAGSEAAWFLAGHGVRVELFEMRPIKMTPVHETGYLAELVCSNSLKSEAPDTAQGVLKAEMRLMGSLILECADRCRVPAGSALAVDRQVLGRLVTEKLAEHPLISIHRQEVTSVPDGLAIIATGPLTEGAFAQSLQDLVGEEYLHFYDAVAPVVTAESIDMKAAFRAARYGRGGDDYINCPLNREEYQAFIQALTGADQHAGHEVDAAQVFEGCMPVEVMARRGEDTLRFGPMRPVGLVSPGGEEPYAVVQLRQEDLEGRLFGLVGFQTRLSWPDQERVFRMIPALRHAEFARLGVMHRNTYVNGRRTLHPTLQLKTRQEILMAGQITGVEGYMESAATGILAGINAARIGQGKVPLKLPGTTMLGALVGYITAGPPEEVKPMNANFGILEPLGEKIRNKQERYRRYGERSLASLREFLRAASI